MINKAIKLLDRYGAVSAPFFQRHFKLCFSEALEIVNQLLEMGYVKKEEISKGHISYMRVSRGSKPDNTPKEHNTLSHTLKQQKRPKMKLKEIHIVYTCA